MNAMQAVAYTSPVTEGEQAQDLRYFRRFDLEHGVGLTANK